MTTNEFRSTFLGYFVENNHLQMPAVNLIPTHRAAPLFTNAGMVAFLPYFFGEEKPVYRRLTSAQKCVRIRGKHDDIEMIGRTTRHLTFFEMLGNFSFGDYFKAGAIEFAWTFLTEVLGLPADRLWATVHVSDDESVGLWREITGMPAGRIQRLGEDNFWEMGPTGPCGVSSEIFYDKGPELGAEGGPAFGGEERYAEIWNLVFMQSNRLPDGTIEPLPERNIDTGAGLERILPILQGESSVFDTDVLRSLIGTAEELCGYTYGTDPEKDVSLRIVADHARASTFLLADGVIPSNEERGYVLRRIIRRAALHSKRAGAKGSVLPEMAVAVSDQMSTGYPDLPDALDRVQQILEREEHRFRETLAVGVNMLDTSLPKGATEIPGDLAFKLHDTYGLPIELTREIAAERGLMVNGAEFDAAMERQRNLARLATAKDGANLADPRLREVAELAGKTVFVGYDRLESEATILGVVPAEGGERVEVYVDVTPFYAEGGGQIGDTGIIYGPGGRGRVVNTDAPLRGLTRHYVEMDEGAFEPGQLVELKVDKDRRAALRRSHTGTHLLHWALREVLGTSAQQQGSLVAPDQLRFDFSHHAPLTQEQIHRVEALVADQIRSNGDVRVEETTQAEAKKAGALSFFGERYDSQVRVIHAGHDSVELCGGTHVHALGDIGDFLIQSESSVGANLRRIEALVGANAYEENYRERMKVAEAARALHTSPETLVNAIDKVQATVRDAAHEKRKLRAELDKYIAKDLAKTEQQEVVVARCDGRNQTELKNLASLVLEEASLRAVGLIGASGEESVAIAVVVADAVSTLDASAAAKQAAAVVGGGGGGKGPRAAVAGGNRVDAIDDAINMLRASLTAE
jgi:alanyl-tRNA synthetase